MIYEKLLKFQQLGIKVTKNRTNAFLKNGYPDLNEVLDKVTKPLNDMGVSIIQTPQMEGLKTVLYDTEDKTCTVSFVPYVGATDMQKLGGAITYARRYSLVSMLGLEVEDDDGNVASAPTPTSTVRR